MSDKKYTTWSVIKVLGGTLLILSILVVVAGWINPLWGIIVFLLILAGANVLFSEKKDIECSQCGYTWQMRKPHTQDNPPANCPKCRRKIT